MKKFILALIVLVEEPKVCLLKSFSKEEDAEELKEEFSNWAHNFIGNKAVVSAMPIKNNDRVLDFVVKYLRDKNKYFIKVLEVEK